jgi:hypothetical protein
MEQDAVPVLVSVMTTPHMPPPMLYLRALAARLSSSQSGTVLAADGTELGTAGSGLGTALTGLEGRAVAAATDGFGLAAAGCCATRLAQPATRINEHVPAASASQAVAAAPSVVCGAIRELHGVPPLLGVIEDLSTA